MKRPAKSESHPAASQFFVRIGTTFLMRIDHRNTIRQSIRRCMVVCDNDIQTRGCMINEFLRGNPTVYCNEHMKSLFGQILQCLGIKAISFCFSLRNIVVHISSHIPKGKVQNRGRRNTIHIIITVDDYFFLLF